MFNKVLYTIVIALLLFVSVGLFLPSTVKVERSIAIDRPASTVFVLVNSFRTFRYWSPLASRDPGAEYVFSGASEGVGARLDWRGDPRLVGNGWQEIIESIPFTRVAMQLDFENQGRAVSYFNLQNSYPGTLLTWGFETDLVAGQGMVGGLLTRYFGLFFDQWIGTDYAQGLANLKAYAESLPATDFSRLDAEILHVPAVDILYIPMSNRPAGDDISTGLAAAHREISSFMQQNAIERLSQPMVITRAWDAHTFEVDAAIPAQSVDVALAGDILAGQSPSGAAVRVVHRGPYESMGPSYEQLSAYMAANDLAEGRVSWEQYISDPEQTPASELITHIYFLIGEDSAEQP
jgi:effector-binding domain-containing protein